MAEKTKASKHAASEDATVSVSCFCGEIVRVVRRAEIDDWSKENKYINRIIRLCPKCTPTEQPMAADS